jgi:beta-glucosidase
MSLDATDLQTLSRLRATGVPVIVVLVSGRPMDIASELGNWAALVAAWLPGTEGQGVADVLFGDYNPTGKLPMTWMQSVSQQPINDGDGKPALFPYGFGLSYPGGPSPSPSTSVSPSSSPSASPSVSPSVSPSSTAPSPTSSAPGGSLACAVTYRITNQWATGFVADVSIAISAGAVNGWTLGFGFPGNQAVTNGWNATVTQSAAQVTATNLSWNGTVSAGSSVTFGLQASFTGTNAAPTAFTLNGTACSAAA